MDIKKIVTCGSVDDGKSTLIGRIIYETKNILDDQKLKLKNLSKRYGTTGSKLDYALLLDGLQDEREQGITIDVAHRYINYKNNRLVFHDSPGHHQYTKNVVTAASNCEIAILLVDSKKGILEQTMRHIKILEFLEIKNIIFAINKIDTINYNKNKYEEIKNSLDKFLKNTTSIKKFYIPISALIGDNVVSKSRKITWYKGKSILDTIISIKNKKFNTDSFLSVQNIHRPNRQIRNFLGDLHGSIKTNQQVKILPSENTTAIKSIFHNFKKVKKLLNSYVSLDLKKQIDISKGDVIVTTNNKNISAGNAFNADVVITSSDKIIPGRQYLIRIHNKISKITVLKIKKSHFSLKEKNININELNLNEIGEIEFTSNDQIVYSTSPKVPGFKNFVLVDELSFAIVCAGKINFELRRSGNIFKTDGKINKSIRAKMKRQKPKCIWLTGLSGSGKSTIAQALEKKLTQQNKHVYILDGDNLRLGVNKNLGFTAADRTENIRRVAEISKLMVDAGLIVIVAVISPFAKDRAFAKSLFEKDEFYEVFINTPLKVCMKRDPKNLYKKARNIKNFSKIGLTNGYEEPKKPFLKIDTSKEDVALSLNKIIKKIF